MSLRRWRGRRSVRRWRTWAIGRVHATPSVLAEQALGYRNTGDWYQTPLRDLAGVLALAAEAGETEMVDRLRRRLERDAPDAGELMTQEQVQLLLAANALQERAGPGERHAER